MNGKYYVTFSEYYPIYEPAEGGYYYEGKQVVEERVFQTRRKAYKYYKKCLKEIDLEMDANCYNGYSFQNDHPNHTYFGVNGRYIGEGYIVELTRKPVKEHGYEPYC